MINKVDVIIPSLLRNKEMVINAIGSVYFEESVSNIFLIIDLDKKNVIKNELIIREIKNKFPKVEVIKTNKNLGAGRARQLGLQISESEFVALQDDDDVSLPGRFVKMINFIKENQLDLAFSNGFVEDNETLEVTKYLSGSIPKGIVLFGTYPGLQATLVGRRSEILSVGGFETDKKIEDLEFVYRSFSKLKIGISPELLYIYNSHDMQSTKQKGYREAHVELFDSWKQFGKEILTPEYLLNKENFNAIFLPNGNLENVKELFIWAIYDVYGSVQDGMTFEWCQAIVDIFCNIYDSEGAIELNSAHQDKWLEKSILDHWIYLSRVIKNLTADKHDLGTLGQHYKQRSEILEGTISNLKSRKIVRLLKKFGIKIL